jgi:hypothetical protein
VVWPPLFLPFGDGMSESSYSNRYSSTLTRSQCKVPELNLPACPLPISGKQPMYMPLCLCSNNFCQNLPHA